MALTFQPDNSRNGGQQLVVSAGDLPQFLIDAKVAIEDGRVEDAKQLLSDRVLNETLENDPSRTDIMFMLGVVRMVSLGSAQRGMSGAPSPMLFEQFLLVEFRQEVHMEQEFGVCIDIAGVPIDYPVQKLYPVACLALSYRVQCKTDLEGSVLRLGLERFGRKFISL